LADSGSERRNTLLVVTSHQADVIQRISDQRPAQHRDVTFQRANRPEHLQVSNKSALLSFLVGIKKAVAEYCAFIALF